MERSLVGNLYTIDLIQEDGCLIASPRFNNSDLYFGCLDQSQLGEIGCRLRSNDINPSMIDRLAERLAGIISRINREKQVGLAQIVARRGNQIPGFEISFFNGFANGEKIVGRA